jgi:hypothetical protein
MKYRELIHVDIAVNVWSWGPAYNRVDQFTADFGANLGMRVCSNDVQECVLLIGGEVGCISLNEWCEYE